VQKVGKRESVVFNVFVYFLSKVLREVRCQSWGILVSHPFQGKIELLVDKRKKFE
jgi:hypothetical protein